MFPWLILAYTWGSILPGVIIARYRFGQDIREKDNPGASGSWRQYGPAVGTLVGALDGVKGALVVLGGLALSLSSGQLVLMVTAVIAGHNWPLWFAFRGGGGLATLAGALLVLSPVYTALGIGVSVALALLYRVSPLKRRLPLASLPAGACLGIPLFLFLTWRSDENTVFWATLMAGSLIAIRGLQMLNTEKKG